MDKYLIAFDLDGTMLLKIDEIAPGTVETVKEASKRGHKVVMASARAPAMTDWVYKAMKLDTPVCNFNGAMINDPTGRFVFEEIKLGQDFVRDLLSKVLPLGIIDFYIEDGNDFYTVRLPFTPYFKEKERLCSTKRITLENVPVMSAHRLVIYSPTEEIRREVEKILDSYGFIFHYTFSNFTRGIRTILNHASANKWLAVKSVAEKYRIPEENIYTFGDEDNDYEMLGNAAHGYALLGSAAHIERGITPTRLTCAEGGVADIIRNVILKD
ncbi:MAG: HAD-IIB family hydrolase [Clostridiales bacterium]|jgi:Cof subfamily protein (haloacid dehalogenase superfamily)|nr:HAD-IIB family hydrolase [Clostridiales bacterium]